MAGLTSQSGARWIADELQGLHDLPQGGQDVSASALLPCCEAPSDIRSCPLYPLPDVARIYPAKVAGVIPETFLKFYHSLKRGSTVC